MDGTGLIGLAFLAVVGGCRDAAADGTAPAPAPSVLARAHVTPPVEWRRLPAVETAASAAAAKVTAAITTIEAWGDPAAGCYAFGIDSRGKVGESIAGSIARLAKGLGALGIDARALPAPVKEVLDAELPFASGGLTGTMRIRLFRTADRVPQALTLVCAGNAREPARCKTQCQALQLQLAPPVAP